MRRFIIYLSIFSLPIVLAVASVMFIPLDHRFSYSEFTKGDCVGRGKWIYDRMFVNEANIDIAFIGTSATWNAIDDSSLTRALSARFGKTVQVANLGYCRPGITLRTQFIQNLIDRKKPKHIVLEVLPNPSMGGHPMFGYMATTEQLLSPPTYLYQDYASDLLNGITVRWAQVRSLLGPDTIHRPNPKLYGFGDNPGLADRNEMDDIIRNQLGKEPLPEESFKEAINYHLFWSNLKFIATICKENQIRLSFLFVNEIGRTVNVPRFQPELEAIAPLWIPNDSVYQNPAFYFDRGHLNISGAQALTPFLTEKLSQFEY